MEKKKRVYIENDKIVKVYNKAYTKAEVFNAALNQTIVEETSIKIPSITKIEQTSEGWAIFMDNIQGKLLDDLFIENPDKIEKYLDYFVQLQLNVQKQICTKLPTMKEKLRKKISSIDLPSDIRFELITRIESMPNQTKLCHGDFSLTNIILDDNGNYYVIDWSHAAIGNGAADCAFTYLNFVMNKQEAIAARYLDKYVAKSEYNRKSIQRIIPVVAASMFNYFQDDLEKFAVLNKWVNTCLVSE